MGSQPTFGDSFDVGAAGALGLDPESFGRYRKALTLGLMKGGAGGLAGSGTAIEDSKNERRAGFEVNSMGGPSGRAGSIPENLTTPPRPGYKGPADPQIGVAPGTSAWASMFPDTASFQKRSAASANAAGMTGDRRGTEAPPTGSISYMTGANQRQRLLSGEAMTAYPPGGSPGTAPSFTGRTGSASQTDIENIPWEQRPESWKTGQYEKLAFEAAKSAPQRALATERAKSSLEQMTEERLRREYLAQTGSARAQYDAEVGQIMKMFPNPADPEQKKRIEAAAIRLKDRIGDVERAHEISSRRHSFSRGFYGGGNPFGGG